MMTEQYRHKLMQGQLSKQDLTVEVVAYKGLDSLHPAKATLVGRIVESDDALPQAQRIGKTVEITLEHWPADADFLICDLCADNGVPGSEKAPAGSVVTFENCEQVGENLVSASGYRVHEPTPEHAACSL